MRKLFLLLFCMVGIVSHAVTRTQDGQLLRDSIFTVYRSISADTARIQYLRDEFALHLDEEWSLELLDSALTSAIRIGDGENEVALRYAYFRYYTFRLDRVGMERSFALLKEACYRFNRYDDYFSAWHLILQLKGTEGNTEYAILESRKMREEAIRLKVSRGVFLSYISEGKSYVFARKPEKSIELYRKALETSRLSVEDKLMAHGSMASSYYFLNRFKEAASELKIRRGLIDDVVGKNPKMLDEYRKVILEIELMYCKLYLAEEDVDKLRVHLNEAAKYYSDVDFSSLAISYHFSWAGYYYLVKDWDKCFPQFELTLSDFKGAQPMYEADIRRIMGDAYMDAGRYREAAGTYKAVVLKTDSINKATLRMNEEAVQANYRIKKALLEKEITETRFWQLAVGAVALYLVLMVGVVIRFSWVRRELVKSEKEMRESYALAEAADKMKEVFLRNITNEIRGPLNAVVGLSDVLCQQDDLTAEEQQEYSTIIRQNAEKLIELIFNILDLSRLESGMMKFNVQEYDMVQLCKDVKLRIEMQEGNTVKLNFKTELESLPVQVDTARFMKLLSSLLMQPEGVGEPCEVEYTLLREGGSLKIVVTNSTLLQAVADERELEIQHTINRLYLEAFKGSYQLSEEDGKTLVIITYPIN